MSDNYILQTGEKGKERLGILNNLINPGFVSFLKDVGIKEGMTVLDIGCGTGILTCEIAKKIGPNGRVIGIDISQEQIEQSRLLAEREKISNVEFRQMSAYDIGDLSDRFDLILTRYVLTHLKEPKKVIKSANKLLTKDGVILCDEMADFETFACHPKNDGYEYWAKAVGHQMLVQGSDGSIGMKLHDLFFENGLSSYSGYAYASALVTEQDKKLLRLGFEEAGPKLVEAGFSTSTQLQAAMDQLRTLETDRRSFALYSKFMRIAARKQ